MSATGGRRNGRRGVVRGLALVAVLSVSAAVVGSLAPLTAVRPGGGHLGRATLIVTLAVMSVTLTLGLRDRVATAVLREVQASVEPALWKQVFDPRLPRSRRTS